MFVILIWLITKAGSAAKRCPQPLTIKLPLLASRVLAASSAVAGTKKKQRHMGGKKIEEIKKEREKKRIEEKRKEKRRGRKKGRGKERRKLRHRRFGKCVGVAAKDKGVLVAPHQVQRNEKGEC